MKRLATLLLATGLVFGATQAAQAIEFKGSGIVQAYFISSNNSFNDDTVESNFSPSQRVRLKLEMIASENLRGVFQIENSIFWGQAASGGNVGGDGVFIAVKHAYLDWVIPSTDVSVRMGLQPFALPAMVAGSSLLVDDVTGITVSTIFNENVSGTLFWIRAYDDSVTSSDAIDLVGLTVPMTFNGFNVTPMAMYGFIGSKQRLNGIGGNNLESANAYWLGLSAELVAFEPFRVALDFNYGTVDGATDALSGDGFVVAAIAEYKFDMVTPGLVLWYGSGNDADVTTAEGTLPSVQGGGAWGVTSFGFNGAWGPGYNTPTFSSSAAGTLGVALQAKKLTFMADLSHLVRVAYYTGTNEVVNDRFRSAPDVARLSDEDTVLEVNVDTTYMIYENLEFILELGYLSADWDETIIGNRDRRDDAYRIAASFGYSF